MVSLATWPDRSLGDEAAQAFGGLVKHLHVGRAGAPWCKHAVESLRCGQFLVADGRATVSAEGIEAAILAAAEQFVRSCPFRGFAESRLDTVTILLGEAAGGEGLERSVQNLRARLLRDGLVVGALHEGSQLRPLTAGTSGYPYRVRSSFATVRWAVAEDALFVSINPGLAALLEAWLQRGGRK